MSLISEHNSFYETISFQIFLNVFCFSPYTILDGFGGPVTQEYIRGPDGNQIGIRYIITKVTEHDAGAYECKVENKFGADQRYLSVNVKLDFSVG